MLNPKPAVIACLASTLALMSCAAPKAIVVAEAPVPDMKKPDDASAASEPAVPNIPNDGIRLPDMLGLPDEGELRSSNAADSGTPESGAVIARPPTKP